MELYQGRRFSRINIRTTFFFLSFIDDIVTEIGSSIPFFADDTSLFTIANNLDVAAEILNADLEKIDKRADAWLVIFSPLKTETLVIASQENQQTDIPFLSHVRAANQ